ncbi:MAG: hypothetical protein ACOC1U_06775 [Spirochaetota bacterium]
MSAKRTALLTVAFLLALPLVAQDISVVLDVASMERASAPRVMGDHVLFTHDFGPGRHDGRINTVEVAFEHENFGTLHALDRNENDLYVLLYPLSDAPETDGAIELRYRMVVNGIWTTDPSNPDRIVDRWGVRLSRTVIERTERTVTETPIVHPDGTVEFIVTAPAGSQVSIVGSFNGWDPFMTPLLETEPGRFTRRLRLGPGEHLYYYTVDGLRVPDPLNTRRKWHTSGRVVSVVSLP